jgi:hypothetical protein
MLGDTEESMDNIKGKVGNRHVAPALAVAALVLLGLGCDRDKVSQTTLAKEAPAANPGAAPMAMPPGTMPPGAMPPGGMPPGAMPGAQIPAPPRPTGKGVIKWSVPKGWTETPGSGMRFATLTPPGPGKVELSVVVLPGAAGGESANVNRWRGQIGLPPLDDGAIAAARKTVKSKAGEVAVFDFTSEGQVRSRMVTGLLPTPDGSTWFLKLMGEEGPVAKAKPAFMKYLETLHLD